MSDIIKILNLNKATAIRFASLIKIKMLLKKELKPLGMTLKRTISLNFGKTITMKYFTIELSPKYLSVSNK